MSEADGVEYVVRGDGTLVEIEAAISPKQEFREFLKLFKDWRMLALFPMFFSSNYCTSKQFVPGRIPTDDQSTHTKEQSPQSSSTVEPEPLSLSSPVLVHSAEP